MPPISDHLASTINTILKILILEVNLMLVLYLPELI